LPGERAALALEASYEIDALTDSLANLLPYGNAVEPQFYAARALASRINELAGIIMSAIQDEADPTSRIRARLTGERCSEEEAAAALPS